MLHAPDEVLVAVEVMRGDGAVNRLAVAAVVLRRHERRDQLALARCERVRAAQQHVDELVERFRGLGPERHRPADAGQAVGSVMCAIAVLSLRL